MTQLRYELFKLIETCLNLVGSDVKPAVMVTYIYGIVILKFGYTIFTYTLTRILDLFFYAYVLQHDNALRTCTKEHYTFVTIINHLHDGKYIYCCEYTYCLREIQHARFEFLRFGYV